MSSFWNSNLSLFCGRFPVLAQRFGLRAESNPPDISTLPFELCAAKNGECTASIQGKFLHSQYNPGREAEQAAHALRTADTLAAAFFGCGLGYTALAYARLFPADTLVIIEPDSSWFFAALSCTDWTDVLRAPNLMLAIQAGVEEVTALIERAGGGNSRNVAIAANPAHTAHAADYFAALAASLKRAQQKELINTNTLEKFSRLWLRNSCANIRTAALLDGVVRYKDACPENLPALVLAAGPTLQQVLPMLAELKKRAVIICVDTALRACLKAGTEPDFILLVDPQYYAWRHIAGLSSPSSILITESAAYPAVYRFRCKETIVCSSLFPLGKYFEKRLGSKGELSAGGSVSTSAWDFARLIGSRRIFLAGLDLGYPGLETHIRGSMFEEKLHTASRRTRPAESGGSAALFGANMQYAKDYAGNDLLTDDRMRMFAWWFESKQSEYPGIASYSLSEQSLAIPGFRPAPLDELLAEPEREAERAELLAAGNRGNAGNGAAFEQVFSELISGLDSLYHTVRSGLSLCEEAVSGAKRGVRWYLDALNAVDRKILQSELKDATALVFPTERQLGSLFSGQQFSADTATASFQRSKIIYRELLKAVSGYVKLLQKYAGTH